MKHVQTQHAYKQTCRVKQEACTGHAWFMWRKLNGTGGAPGVADAVTYTLVWAGGKESSRWRTAGAEEALIDVGGSDEKCLAQCP